MAVAVYQVAIYYILYLAKKVDLMELIPHGLRLYIGTTIIIVYIDTK